MKKACCLISSLIILPQICFADLKDYNFYYINGVNNTPRETIESSDALRSLVLPDVSPDQVRYLYQQNLGTLTTMINNVRNQAILDNQRDTYKRFWSCLHNPRPDVCNSTNPLAPDMYQMVISTLTALDELAYVQYPRLMAMVNTVRDAYANGRKSLLIGHSQGTFYANQVSNYLSTHYPDVAACTDIVNIATPATYVAKSSDAKPGRWETRDDDKVINFARYWWAWGGQILPPTLITNGTPGDFWTKHNFIESYISPNFPRNVIRADIEAQAVTLANSPCKLDQVKSSCGTPISGVGSSGVKEYVMQIGQTPQFLTANFEAFSIPDQLSLYANGIKLASSGGLVSGFHTYSFAFDPQALGTTQLLARVEGNSDPSTLWTLCIDCKGSTASPCATSPRRDVSISLSYTWDTEWFCTAGQVDIDGVSWGYLTNTSPIKVQLAPTTGAEYHELSAPKAGCLCTQTLCWTDPLPKLTFGYNDGNGKLLIFDAPLSRTTKFSIQ